MTGACQMGYHLAFTCHTIHTTSLATEYLNTSRAMFDHLSGWSEVGKKCWGWVAGMWIIRLLSGTVVQSHPDSKTDMAT